MKRLILVLGVMLFATTAWSAPYLVTDCQDTPVDNYKLVIDGTITVNCAAQQLDCPAGQVRLSFEMSQLNLSNGNHSLTGQACIDSTATVMGGCSDSVPFDFSKVAPMGINSFGLSETP